MKAPDFAYARPTSLPEVFDLLAGHDNARVLAGGQSLITALNLRLTQPSLLIDINRIAGLDGIAVDGPAVRIGAMTRHHAIATSPIVAQHLPLLAKAGPHIAHQAIRNRGTIGGSLALADPATEWPACCLALDAVIVAAARDGERRIAARDFFVGLYETTLADTEIIVAVEFPLPGIKAVCGFDELSRRQGDYAMVGLATQGVRGGHGFSALNLAFFGAGDRPLLAANAANALVAGEGIAAAQVALASDLSPTDDGECSAATKHHLTRVLLGRVIGAMERGA